MWHIKSRHVSKRFLIIDDDALCRRMLQTHLSRYGRCEMAENGKDGFNLYQEALATSNPYELICVDLIMQDTNGHRLIREIRDYENDQPTFSHTTIFAVISVDSAYDKSELLRKEVCESYIVKPFDPISIAVDVYKWVLNKP